MLSSIIVDDERPARDELRYLLSLVPDVVVRGEAQNAAEGIQLAAQEQPDVVFLDISMRDMDGLAAAALIRKVAPGTMIVFATAYDEYAIKAFELGAVDYLLKPFEEERIRQTVQRLQAYQKEEKHAAVERVDEVLEEARIQIDKLPVEKNGSIRLLNYGEIVYAYAKAGNVTVVTAKDEAIYNGTLCELEERMNGTHMMRVHKSYVVNLDKIREVVPWFKGTYWLKMEHYPEVEIPVSKSQIKELKIILGLK